MPVAAVVPAVNAVTLFCSFLVPKYRPLKLKIAEEEK
jgi:hypothetical protein